MAHSYTLLAMVPSTSLPGLPLVLVLLLIGLLFLLNAALIIGGTRLLRRHRQSQPRASEPSPTESTVQRPACPRCGNPTSPGAFQGLCPRCVFEAGLGTQTDARIAAVSNQDPQLPSLSIEEVATLFPQLEILECLGRGGMGTVYKARQPKLNRLVALKVLAKEKGADPRFAERFLREAQALARLDHPNIVKVHEFGEVDGLYFLILEYVDGLTLRQFLREGRLPPEEAIAIVPRICEALQYAHGKGVVHRDIKPENVLIDREGHVKIADFGIAKLVGADAPAAHLTAERQVIGTPHYMAPEQVEAPQRVDHRADIYSLGVVFYELLTGELPLGRFAPPSSKIHDLHLDVRLDEVVLKTLEKEPERRFQHARDVKTAVEHLNTPTPVPIPSPTTPPLTLGPRAAFGLARNLGIGVGLTVCMLATVATLLLPKSYLATARIEFQRITGPGAPAMPDPFLVQTEFEKIQSTRVLSRVVTNLNLSTLWAARANAPALSDSQCVGLLRRTLSLKQLRDTALIEIQVHSQAAQEAADIANAIATAYRDLNTSTTRVNIVEEAVAAPYPARPNLPLNLLLGALSALTLGLMTAGLVILLTWRPRQVLRPAIGPSGKARLALGLLLAGTLGTLMLMALSSRHEYALLFGALSLLLALGFGLATWRERLGKGVAITVGLLVLGLSLVALLVFGLGFFNARKASALAEAAQMREAELRSLAEQTRAARISRPQTATDLGFTPTTNEPLQRQLRPPQAMPHASPESPKATVNADGSGSYPTIQAAINAEPPGSVIRIGPGRFPETLTITQAVTLQGAGWDQTIIGPIEPRQSPSPAEVAAAEKMAAKETADPQRARALVQAALQQWIQPVVKAQSTGEVQLQGLRLTLPGLPAEGRLAPVPLLEARGGPLRITDCALVGSPGIGLMVHEGSNVRIDRSLIAAVWNTGIVIERGNPSQVEILDCDIRNCHYAGMTIGRGQTQVLVRACRISGAAWHGVRYDDAGPELEGNLIFGNARSGIYASGRTQARVQGNVFFENEMNGMSCWFNNADRITGNTFFRNQREAISILGGSSPTVQSNLFTDHAIAVFQGKLNSQSPGADAVGTPTFTANAVWNNQTNFVQSLLADPIMGDFPADAATLKTDPLLQNPGSGEFQMKPSSVVLQRGIGCIAPLPLASPCPLQAEEKAIIPDGATRDYRQWKR